MATAGRILLIPKGKYNAATTYENLDMVLHNGNTWIAKKSVVGIEPSEAASEHWFKATSIAIANDLATEVAGYALDARQGKALNEAIINVKKDVSLLEKQTENDLAALRKDALDNLMMVNAGIASCDFSGGMYTLPLMITVTPGQGYTQLRCAVVNGFGTGHVFACSVIDADPAKPALSIKCLTDDTLTGAFNLSVLLFFV